MSIYVNVINCKNTERRLSTKYNSYTALTSKLCIKILNESVNFLYLKAVVLVWCSEKSNTKSNNAVAACSVISLLLWQIIINIQDVYLNLIFTFFLVLYEATQFNRRFYGRGTEITDTPEGQFM